MMEETNLTTLHAAIKTAIRAEFTEAQVPTIDYYTRPTKTVATPAIFFELTGLTPSADDPGTEQSEMIASFTLYVLVSYRTEAAKMAVRELAGKLCNLIYYNRWGLKIGAAELTGAQPDQFSVEPGGSGNGSMQCFETWSIDWTHEILLGTSVWDTDPEPIPTEVYVGIDPDIGPDHIDDYQQVQP